MKSRLIQFQQDSSSMEGKVIKEETSTAGSPCSPSPTTVGNSTNNNNNNGTLNLTNTLPSGKENRRVPSPVNASEILTRSRAKVLTKDPPHHRMSESPKISGVRSGSPSATPPPMSGVKANGAHIHQSSHNHSFSHQFSSPHRTSSSLASGANNSHGNGSSGARRTPSPSANAYANNIGTPTSSNSSSSGRTPSSSTQSQISGTTRDGQGQGMNSGASKYIIKIKRFLGTLLQFGNDISPEVGDRVRTLVFNLVSGLVTMEDFHHSLQEVTSFPLRPFVLPFLRTHLPLLQREISHLARISKQTPLTFIRSHEQLIVETGSTPGELCDIFHSEASDLGFSGKRKVESVYENGESNEPTVPAFTSTPKRHHHGGLFSPPFFIGTLGTGGLTQVAGLPGSAELRDYYSTAYPLLTSGAGSSSHHSHSHAHDSSSSSSSNQSVLNPSGTTANGMNTPKGAEDEWKNIHMMLNCILSMVDKTKRALSILQNRTFHNEGDSSGSASANSWLRRPTGNFSVDSTEDFKRHAGEMMAQALRATEDRVAEVKRRAEEAVQEVKRQALAELQRAVAAAEARACEAVVTERARLERTLTDPRRGNSDSVPVHLDQETCWNCGRKGHETCSGCNTARYCSSFCQYKDWEHHHAVCGKNTISSERERERSERSSGSNNVSEGKRDLHIQESSNSSPINVSHQSPENHSPCSN